ncbi:NAD(P)H-dependent oxidoreductase [Polaribacter sp.]|nr:NAD(P)H-dependent oxidoreductase [Polaribacter sp.]
MDIIESLEWRYAVKKFDSSKKVTAEKIELLKKAFSLTATSYGLQPIKLVIVQNEKIQEKLVPLSFNQQQVADASHLLVICVPAKFSSKDVDAYFNLVKEIRQTPDEITKPFKLYMKEDIERRDADFLFNWNKNQAYIALGNLLTVCATKKIDSCPMEGFIPDKYDELLGLNEKNLRSVLVLPIGYRAEDDFMKDLKKVRKPIEETTLVIE